MFEQIKYYVKTHAGQITIFAITAAIMGLIAGAGIDGFARGHH